MGLQDLNTTKEYTILRYCPSGFKLRPNQVEILKQVEDNWDRYHVIVIPAQVGSGKSLVAQTIARWRASKEETTATITPRVALQTQYQRDFPKVPTLMGKSRYSCTSDKGLSCADHFEIYDSYCSTCPYKAAKKAVEKSDNAVFNFHSYLYSKDYKDNLIVDEAHNIYSIMSEMFSAKIWKHQHNYPDDINVIGDVALWMEGVIKSQENRIRELEDRLGSIRFSKKHKITDVHKKEEVKLYLETKKVTDRYRMVLKGIRRAPTNFFIEHKEGMYRGELKDFLYIRPTTLHDSPEILWPQSTTKKIVMLSGTITELDMSHMGLVGKKILFVDAVNPIPPENRPVIVDNLINMSWKYQEKNIPKMVDKIDEVLSKHPNKKGIIHTTYGLAGKFRKKLKNKRIMWHTKEDKDEVLKKFLEAKDPVVLMACGFAEGIDLKGSNYEFQIITKIQWPSKEDKLIEYLYTHQIERIMWETVRTVQQQIGRICRGYDDYGVTYILDSSFGNVAKKRQGLFQRTTKYWPKSVVESIKFI